MSTGFTFGAKTSQTPTFGTSSITQGQQQQPQQQQFGFGTATAAIKPTIGGNFSFGSTSTPGVGFGSTAQSTFGNPSTAPTFGSNTQPGFGFGTPTSTPSTGLTFGTPSSGTSAGLGFGTPTTSTNLSFGQPSIGFGTSTASTGLNFGTTTTTNTGLGFGTPSSSTTNLGFGAPAVSTGLSFGQQSTGLNFGATSSAANLNFGQPSTSLSFGTPTTSSNLGQSSTSFGLGTSNVGLNFGQPSTSLSFGTPTTNTLNFSQSSTGITFGGGLTSKSGLSGNNCLSTPIVNTISTENVGLGGVVASQIKTGPPQKEVLPKDQQLPNELLQLVDQFKKLVHNERMQSSEVARSSIKDIRNVESDLNSLCEIFRGIETQLLNNRNLVEQLKYDTAKGLQNIEMAQRSYDTPPGLQYENTAPMKYFLELVDTLEKEMSILKIKIDNTEQFIKKGNKACILTSDDLIQGIKRLHEIFVSLSGRMHSIHNQVEEQKEIFLNSRRQITKDLSNPFDKVCVNNNNIETIINPSLKSNITNLSSGPTPFSSIPLTNNNLNYVEKSKNLLTIVPSRESHSSISIRSNTDYQSPKTIFSNKRAPT